MAQIVTITNPLTGQPAQVDQLDHTAQEIDDGIARALPGGAIDQRVSMLPGQNLLDNSVFLDGCLVDQRQGYVVPPGVTYTTAGSTDIAGTTDAYCKVTGSDTYGNVSIVVNGTTYWTNGGNAVRGYTVSGYGIDRWRLGNSGALACITVDTDGLSLHPGATGWNYSEISQPLEDNTIDYLTDKQVTVSALIGGNLYTHTFVFGTNNYVADFAPNLAFMSIKALSCHPFFRWTGEVTGFLAAKLELGITQTLAHQDENGNWVLNEIPDYGEQLARCQRYFIELNPNNAKYNTVAVGVGWSGGTEVDFVIPIPTTMRANPTIVNLSNFHCVDTTDISWHNFTSANCYLGSGFIKMVGFIDASVSGRTYALMCDKNSLKMHLSADL